MCVCACACVCVDKQVKFIVKGVIMKSYMM